MASLRSKQETRRQQYKKGIDADESRRKREETTFEIRKSKRDEGLMKRRNISNLVETSYPVDLLSGKDLPSDLNILAQGIFSNDKNVQLTCTTKVRRMLSVEKNPPIDAVIKAGLVPRFVSFLAMNEDVQLQLEAAWALTNVASGNTLQTKAVIDAGAVPAFLSLVSSPNKELCEQVVWALGNIAGEGANVRDLLLSMDAAPLILRVVQRCLQENDFGTLLSNTTWTLSNLCRFKPSPPMYILQSIIPVVAHLIMTCNDPAILVDAVWALSYITDDGEEEKLSHVIAVQGLVNHIVNLLLHPNQSLHPPALRVLGNIVTGNERQTQVVIDCGAIIPMRNFLNSPKKLIKKEACWALSNITAGSVNQIQQVINDGVIPPLIKVFKNSDFDVKKEACWALTNIIHTANPIQVRYMIQQGVLNPIAEMLEASDAKIVHLCLQSIRQLLDFAENEKGKSNILVNPIVVALEENGGLDSIEQLQSHANENIYKLAVDILEQYFQAEDENDQNVEPNIASHQTSFVFNSQPTLPSGGFVF